MENRFQAAMEDRGDNYLLPFLWMRDGKRALWPQLIEKIHQAGIGAFCVESRTHEGFVQENWWQDMALVLEEAKKRGMKVWILDDRHFPTGECAGLIARKYPERRKWHLKIERTDVLGPAEAQTIPLRPASAERELLRVFAYPYGGDDDSLNLSCAVELTAHIRGRFLYWNIPDGRWRVCALYKTREGARHGYENYFHPIDAQSVDTLVEAVYEPHYQHFSAYFGGTIAGFFSDEPALHNAFFNPNHYGQPDMFSFGVGQPDLALPWSEEIIPRMQAELGFDPWPLLPCLLHEIPDERTGALRTAYMNAVTGLWRENFSYKLGNWCRAHGVQYIGHIIEDNNAHTKMGFSAGHYFRALEGQDMAGIDIVLHQIMPGMGDCFHTASGSPKADGEFYFSLLGQLAASAAHLEPLKQGRAMCEVFGAYGWGEGVPLMKWLMDFLLVRGVNHFVPHAFSPDFPDADCPPHFYALGNNPQFPDFGVLMRYVNRMSHLLSGGVYAMDAAVLYQAEAEWAGGRFLNCQRVAKALSDDQLSYHIVSTDYLLHARVEGNKLVINGHSHDWLLIPDGERWPQAVLEQIAALEKAGARVLTVRTAESAWLNRFQTAALSELSTYLRQQGAGKLQFAPAYKEMRCLRLERDAGVWTMLFNESPAHTFQGTVRTGLPGDYALVDALTKEVRRGHTKNGEIALALSPYQSVLLVQGGELPEGKARTRFSADRPLPCEYEVSLRSYNEKEFKPLGVFPTLRSITAPECRPEFSGVIRYRAKFMLEDTKGLAALDLGTVGETARLILNGHDLGRRVCPPYIFRVEDALKIGENTLEIFIANSLAYAIEDRFSSFMQLSPSGLLGPVRWLREEPVEG